MITCQKSESEKITIEGKLFFVYKKWKRHSAFGGGKFSDIVTFNFKVLPKFLLNLVEKIPFKFYQEDSFKILSKRFLLNFIDKIPLKSYR